MVLFQKHRCTQRYHKEQCSSALKSSKLMGTNNLLNCLGSGGSEGSEGSVGSVGSVGSETYRTTVLNRELLGASSV